MEYTPERCGTDPTPGALLLRTREWKQAGASGLLGSGSQWLKPTAEAAVDGALGMVARARALSGPSARSLTLAFVIVGAQRCGTTSMYHYLGAHPQVVPALTKEVHFFDLNYGRGKDWYAAHFLTERLAAWRSTRLGAPVVTGEASPYYMFHPHAMRRLHEMLPDTKIIVMLRDPVQRAISHYSHERAKGFETADLPAALDLEEARLAGEEEQMVSDDSYSSFAHQHYCYLGRGDYVPQLERIHQFYDADRVHVINSNDFYRNSSAGYAELLLFLGLREHKLPAYKQYNTYRSTKPDGTTRSRLVRHFAPRNAALYEYLGRDLGWSR